MPGLTARDLARMTDIQEDYLYSTCDITRTTGWGQSAIGGGTPTESTDSDVVCRFQPAEWREEYALLGDIPATEEAWMLTVKKTQNISNGDTVTFNSVAYKAIAVDKSHSWETVRRVVCLRQI